MKIRRLYTCLYTPPRPSGFDPRFGPDAPSFERICTRFFENSIFEKSSTKSIGLFNGNRRVSRVPMVALGGRAKFKGFLDFRAPPAGAWAAPRIVRSTPRGPPENLSLAAPSAHLARDFQGGLWGYFENSGLRSNEQRLRRFENSGLRSKKQNICTHIGVYLLI